jgi:RimJ/RimL family protein N-acetyltransferase
MMAKSKLVDERAEIYLRPMVDGDAEWIVKWRNLDEVRSRFIYRELFTEEGHRQWVHTMIETGKAVQMMICDMETDKPLGSVYIRDIDSTHKKGEYGIFIGEAEGRGRGVGTAAAELMLGYAFTVLDLHKVYLRVFTDNPGAIRSYEKAGFEKEGYLRDEVCIDGAYRDMLWMAAFNNSEA